MIRRAILVAGICAVLAPAAWAEGSWSGDLAHELMSPFCPGRTLATCPSDKAAELVAWMKLQETAGASRDEVEAQLVARFGEQILPAPPPRDFIAIAGYAVPILAIVAGAPLVFRLLRRLTDPAPGDGPSAPLPAGPVDGELAAQVDRELRERSA